MKKHWKKIIILLFLFIFIGVLRSQNVFDEIYYSRITSRLEYELKPFKSYRGNFYFMPQIKGQERDMIAIDLEHNIFAEYYKEEYLNENESLQITCYARTVRGHKKVMFFNYYYNNYDEDNTLLSQDYYEYIYYVDDKTLVYDTNDPENTEKKQFLFDIFLRDYFEALGWRSGYSMDNLGYFKFVDTTLEGYEEDGKFYRNAMWELPYQIPAIVILVVFYVCYFIKMLSQRKKGIKTDQLGKGKSGREKRIEIIVKFAAYLVPLAELFSIYFKTTSFPMWIRMIGIAIGFLGVIVFIISVMAMKDNWRAGVSSEDKTRLVTKGIYQLSRNPAFLGFDLMYIGILILFFNWILFLITVFGIVMFHLQIVCVEEPFLRSTFVDEYLAYVEKVERYIGRP